MADLEFGRSNRTSIEVVVSKASENRMGYFSRINLRAEKNKQQIHNRKKGETARRGIKS